MNDDIAFDITSPFLAAKASNNRTFAAGETTTVYLPFPFDATQFGKVYQFKGLNEEGTGVLFMEKSAGLKANTPYVIEPNGTKISAANVQVEAWVSTSVTGADEMMGVCKDVLMPADAYEYDGVDGKVKKVPSDVAVSLKAGRAYFLLPNADVSAAYGLDVIFGQSQSTGITNAESTMKHCGHVYNLQGQRMTTAPRKGLYIVNGKKIVK